MFAYRELNVVTDDYVINNHMVDIEEFELFRSEPDANDLSHLILLIEWQNDQEVAHTFDYSIDDLEEGVTTQATALSPEALIDDLPEECRDAATAAIMKWQAAHDATVDPQP